MQAVVNGEVSVRDAERAGTRPREEHRRAIDGMRNGKGRTLTASLDLFENMDAGPAAGDYAKGREKAPRSNGATAAPVPVAVPTIAEAERARNILGRIDLDPIASDASNAIVKAARAGAAEHPDIDWTGTAWLRIAHDAHALARAAQCVDAVAAGSLESVLVDLPSASCVHAPAQELLAIAERIVIRAGTPTVTVLAGDAGRAREGAHEGPRTQRRRRTKGARCDSRTSAHRTREPRTARAPRRRANMGRPTRRSTEAGRAGNGAGKTRHRALIVTGRERRECDPGRSSDALR